jgi:rhomboid protease GluP
MSPEGEIEVLPSQEGRGEDAPGDVRQPANSIAPEPTISERRKRQEAVAAFKRHLREVSPRAPLVPAIIAANVVVFAVMVASGVDSAHPAVSALLRWGANSGSTTVVRHQSWRILSSAFLHAGFAHLFFNMLALLNVGGIVERIFGGVRMAAIYLCAAVMGGVASLLAHPDSVCVGASGAIFGVYGALGGFALRERGAVTGPVIRELRTIAVTFVAYNLLYSFRDANIDVAAHLGGLLGGLASGAWLSRPLTVNRSAALGPPLALGLGSVALMVLSTFGVHFDAADLPLAEHQFPGFGVSLPSGPLDEEPGASYAMGATHARRSGLQVMVLWASDKVPGKEALKLALPQFAAELGGPVGELIDVPSPLPSSQRQSWTVQIGTNAMWITTTICGERHVILRTISARPGVQVLHRRIVQTFTCSPEPKEEAVLGRIPLTIDGDDDWRLVTAENTDEGFQVTDGTFLVGARESFGVNDAEELIRFMNSHPKFGIHFSDPIGDHREVTFSPDGKGVAAMRTCADRNRSLLVMVSAIDQQTSGGIDVLRRVRCLSADETLREWPLYKATTTASPSQSRE